MDYNRRNFCNRSFSCIISQILDRLNPHIYIPEIDRELDKRERGREEEKKSEKEKEGIREIVYCIWVIETKKP